MACHYCGAPRVIVIVSDKGEMRQACEHCAGGTFRCACGQRIRTYVDTKTCPTCDRELSPPRSMSQSGKPYCHNCNKRVAIEPVLYGVRPQVWCATCMHGTVPCPACRVQHFSDDTANGNCVWCERQRVAKLPKCPICRQPEGSSNEWGPVYAGKRNRTEKGWYLLSEPLKKRLVRDYGISSDAKEVCAKCYHARAHRYSGVQNADIVPSFRENTSRRLVGIEIEFIALGYPEMPECGTLKTDVSVHRTPGHSDADYVTCEFATNPARGDQVFANIRKLCDELAACGSYANDSCGLHVHLDMSETRHDLIVRAWHLFEPIIFRFVAPPRRANDYCRPITRQHAGHYMALNQDALREHGTLEWRLHHGTVDAEEIIAWVRFLLAFADGAAKGLKSEDMLKIELASPRGKIVELMKLCNADEAMKADILRRLKAYNTEQEVVLLLARRKGKGK